MIRFDRVSFRYNEKIETSFFLKEVSFHLEKGHLVGILGKNGSGKSTIAKLLSGLIAPQSGQIIINKNSQDAVAQKNENKVGLIFQNPDSQIVGLTVEEDLAFGLENLGLDSHFIKERIEKISQLFNLDDLLEEPISVLSGGQKQLLCIASVMVTEPEWLIFDEPTSHLDPWARKKFWDILKDIKDTQKKGIAVITQIESDYLKFDRVLIVNDGKANLIDPKDSRFWGILSENGLEPPEEIKFENLKL